LESLDAAETVCGALQVSVTDLRDGAFKKADWDKGDIAVLHAEANPRFTAIAETDLTGPELLVAHERMKRIRGPISASPTAEERFVRLYCSVLSPMLESCSPNATRVVPKVRRTDERSPATVGVLQGNHRRRGGRPKLGDPMATPQQKFLLNAYELVRKALRPGWGPKTVYFHFEHERDFKSLVKQAGKDFSVAFCRAALAWIKENPAQETQSGKVS
jgi:hypothetical protein